MENDSSKYPTTLIGMYENDYSKTFLLNSLSMDQERADQICAAIQAGVGGIIEVREWGGVSKNGKNLPQYKLQVVSAKQVADRKAFIAAQGGNKDENL